MQLFPESVNTVGIYLQAASNPSCSTTLTAPRWTPYRKRAGATLREWANRQVCVVEGGKTHALTTMPAFTH